MAGLIALALMSTGLVLLIVGAIVRVITAHRDRKAFNFRPQRDSPETEAATNSGATPTSTSRPQR